MAAEKRSQEPEEAALKENVLLIDIEGTTTSISFVKETLFPYVREHLKEYIDAKWDEEEFKEDLKKLKEQEVKDTEDKVEGVVSIIESPVDESKESLIKNVLWQMDNDRKAGALKQLQGHMWRDAYKSGSVKGHVYEDVPEALKSWTESGRKVYIYSSGSVEAQKLLFAHSTHGDLLKFFSGHFDTEVGGKQEEKSYKNILGKIDTDANNVVFLTDVVKEAEAAKSAGINSIIVIREGNAALTDSDKSNFTTIKSFLDLSFQTSVKRQKVEEPSEEKTEKKEDKVEDVEMKEASDKKEEVEKVEDEVKKEVAVENVEKPVEKCEKPAETVEKVEKMETSESTETDSSSVKRKDDENKETKEEPEKSKEEEKKAEEVVEKPVTNGEEKKIEIVEEKVVEEKKIDDELPVIPAEAEEEKKKSNEEPEESTPTKPVEEPKDKTETTTPVEPKDDKKPSEEVCSLKPKVEESAKSSAPEEVEKVEEKKEEAVCKVEKTKTEEKVEEKSSDKVERTEEKREEKVEEEAKESTEAKVNGTTQNGDSEAKEDDKPHNNGNGVLEKAEVKESNDEKKEEVVAQNGDSEAIKVKKVVEPTIAEGASEPVAVAATS